MVGNLAAGYTLAQQKDVHNNPVSSSEKRTHRKSLGKLDPVYREETFITCTMVCIHSIHIDRIFANVSAKP